MAAATGTGGPAPRGPRRLRPSAVETLYDTLSSRDWEIIDSVNRLRLVDALQLERLHFTHQAPTSRRRRRHDVLHRLERDRVLVALARRSGGAGGGGEPLAYALDTGGHRLLVMRANASMTPRRIRRPRTPSHWFVRHTLDIAELYVRLVEHTRARPDHRLEAFDTEPGCWWPDGNRGLLKPDAYLRLARTDNGTPVADHWWAEIDRDTESLPALTRHLAGYVAFAEGGQRGPGGILPRVLVTTTTTARADAIRAALTRVPNTPPGMFDVLEFPDAVPALTRHLDS